MKDAVRDYLAAIGSKGGKAGTSIDKRRAAIKRWANRKTAKISDLIRVCPGGRHAYFKSDCGEVRKPIVTR